MPSQNPLSKAPARKLAKKKVASKSRKKPVAKRTMAARAPRKTKVQKTIAAKAPVKASAVENSAAKKTSVKKPATKKPSVAFAKTNKPVVPLRERPLSPHLSIYRPQITSVLSILHRGTGVALYIGAFAVAWLIACLGYGPNCFNASLALLNNIPGMIAIYGIIFCLFYHLCNGIRHLAWDIGEGFELPTVTLSGLFVLMVSISLTLAIYLINHPECLQQLQAHL